MSEIKTELSVPAKSQIMKQLREEGYPSYCVALDLFDVFLTNDPTVVGYMVPGKAKIVLNEGLDIEQVSFIVRHEILHEVLSHGIRLQTFHSENTEYGAPDPQLSNIAADLELSNFYTPKDVRTAKAIRLNGEKLRGLLIEDHPDWKYWSYEEIYTHLMKEKQDQYDRIKDLLDMMSKLSKKLAEDEENAEQLDSPQQTERNIQQTGTPKTPMKDNPGSKLPSVNKQTDDPQDEEPRKGGGGGKGDNESEIDANEKVEDENNSVDGIDGMDEDDEDTEGSTTSTSTQQDDVDELKDEIEDAQDALKDATSSPDPNEPFKDKIDGREIADVVARVKKIQDLFKDIKYSKQVQTTTMSQASAQRREKEAKLAQATKNSQSSYAKNMRTHGGLRNFKLDLQQFINNEVAEEEATDTFRRNTSYKYSRFHVPARVVHQNMNVPVINVYWDVSGSFSDPKKTAAARAAIDTLQMLVRQGKIAIYTYYHANRVTTDPETAGKSNDGDELVNHIKKTHPDNAIIISDDNINHISSSVSIPGAIWYLFYDSTAPDFVAAVKGRKQTRAYLIDY